MYSDLQLREIFHFLYLERLLAMSDPNLFALKGGVNLRFFFNSPRYSEDLDLDVFGGSVETHKKYGYKILEDAAFARTSATFGIVAIRVNDKKKAKHTPTTQRFRCRLVNQAGEELPTKVEYSHRTKDTTGVKKELIHPEVGRLYRRRSYLCPHYQGETAVSQKIHALAWRSEVQARDLFDLYMLYTGGFWSNALTKSLDQEVLSKATESALSIDFADFRGQVLEFLEEDEKRKHDSQQRFQEIQEIVLRQLNG